MVTTAVAAGNRRTNNPALLAGLLFAGNCFFQCIFSTKVVTRTMTGEKQVMIWLD
jgi:hypothetical protein